MKEPIFKGIRPGYTAIFIGEETKKISKYDLMMDWYLARGPRLRTLSSHGFWCWYFHNEKCLHDGNILSSVFDKRNDIVPCWMDRDSKVNGQDHKKRMKNLSSFIEEELKMMKDYDQEYNRKTIFLGYVKEN